MIPLCLRESRRDRSMMGRLKSDQGQLFYVHLSGAIPEDHLVRKIDAALDLSWLRSELASHYSGCLFFRMAMAHECSITTRCLRSPAGRIESWRRGAGSRSPTIGRRALR
jgi:hypothetical protein